MHYLVKSCLVHMWKVSRLDVRSTQADDSSAGIDRCRGGSAPVPAELPAGFGRPHSCIRLSAAAAARVRLIQFSSITNFRSPDTFFDVDGFQLVTSSTQPTAQWPGAGCQSSSAAALAGPDGIPPRAKPRLDLSHDVDRHVSILKYV